MKKEENNEIKEQIDNLLEIMIKINKNIEEIFETYKIFFEKTKSNIERVKKEGFVLEKSFFDWMIKEIKKTKIEYKKTLLRARKVFKKQEKRMIKKQMASLEKEINGKIKKIVALI